MTADRAAAADQQSAPHAVVTRSFDDSRALAAGLAARVAERLRAAIETRGAALLAVSGGRTPTAFLEQLAQARLDWARVTVTLVDERWVDEHDPRSNARLVREHLLRGPAAAARLVPLYTGASTPEAGRAEAAARIAALALPFDAVVLGMGDDGHTASFFPGGDHLAEAVDPAGTEPVWPMRAAAAGEPRITLSLPVLLQTRLLVLHIEGEAKRAVFTDARRGRDYPIRTVLAQDRVPLDVYWCP